MAEFLEVNNKLETKWLKTGEALGVGTKIYGHRVDNVHVSTYKMIGVLNRGQDQEVELIEEQEEPEEGRDDSP